MATSKSAQLTDFTMDILGRYMCNGFDEAMHSADKNAQRPDGSPQSDARPFNAIIIGGGSFGGVLAQHLLYADETNSYRILVLEAGRNSLPEHFQNLPLQAQPMEMWGLPWDSDPKDKFPGLAYAVGGRSLFFGGWSPRLLDEEMDGKWPPNVVAQLKARYFDEAARQIGTRHAVRADARVGRRHQQVLLAVQFVHRRDAAARGAERALPQLLAGVGIVDMQLVVAARDEDQAAGGRDDAEFEVSRRARAGHAFSDQLARGDDDCTAHGAAATHADDDPRAVETATTTTATALPRR